MAAIYWVHFDDGHVVSVNSADARSNKTLALRKAYRKAADKAKKKHAREFPGKRAKVTRVACVG